MLGPAAAQRPPIDTTPDPDEERSIFTLQIENDFFNPIGRSDRDYTNGIRFGWLSPALPDLPDGITRLLTVPTFLGEAPVSSVTRRVGLSFGQNIYTPQDTQTSQPIPNDRPYAASSMLESTALTEGIETFDSMPTWDSVVLECEFVVSLPSVFSSAADEELSWARRAGVTERLSTAASSAAFEILSTMTFPLIV